MSKILFFISCLFISSFYFSQTVYSENFDASSNLPAGWTTFVGNGTNNLWSIQPNGNSAPNSAQILGETSATYAFSWIVTPLININASDLGLLFDLKRSNSVSTNTSSSLIVRYSTTSQTNTSSFSTLETFSETEIAANADSNGWSGKYIDLASLSGQSVYLAFVFLSNNPSDDLLLDNLEVKSLAANDGAITSVNLPQYFGPGNQDIQFNLTNAGGGTLNSAEITYSIDGGSPMVESFSGFSLNSYESTQLSFSVPWNAIGGIHDVTVEVSTVNGVTDSNPTNNGSTQSVSVASNTTTKKLLYEQFTSSTCGPCATVNNNYFTPAYLNSLGDQFTLIKYQMNWPSPGDPYYTAEGGVRRAYYGVSGVPTIFLQGVDDLISYAGSNLINDFNSKIGAPAFMSIAGQHAINGNDIETLVTINPYISADLTLHVVAVEKLTTGNVGNNGETEFYNVMMKMITPPQGLPVSFTDGTPFQQTFDVNMSGTHVEQMSDLEIVIFVQDDSNKDILQSAYSVDNLGVEDVQQGQNIFVMAPNPSHGLVKIDSDEVKNVEVYSLSGKVVHRQENLQNQTLDLSHLEKGIYLVKVESNNGMQTQKLILQ